MIRALVLALAAGLLGACGSIGKGVDSLERAVELDKAAGTYPKNSTLIPNVKIGLSPSNTISLEQLAYGAAGAALLYYVFDPLAPNWEISEAKLADDVYRLSLKMKRFHTGGDGEALMIVKRRATQLKYEKGFADFQLVELNEGIESSTPIAQRYSEAIVRLVKAPAAGN